MSAHTHTNTHTHSHKYKHSLRHTHTKKTFFVFLALSIEKVPERDILVFIIMITGKFVFAIGKGKVIEMSGI